MGGKSYLQFFKEISKQKIHIFFKANSRRSSGLCSYGHWGLVIETVFERNFQLKNNSKYCNFLNVNSLTKERGKSGHLILYFSSLLIYLLWLFSVGISHKQQNVLMENNVYFVAVKCQLNTLFLMCLQQRPELNATFKKMERKKKSDK